MACTKFITADSWSNQKALRNIFAKFHWCTRNAI